MGCILFFGGSAMIINENNVGIQPLIPYTYNTYGEYTCSPRYLFETCQEVAAMHAALRGMAVPDLLKDGKTWVITREKMLIKRYPVWGDTLLMKTGVPEAKSYFAPRSMIALDSEGKEFFRASTMWAIVDYNTRMPVRVGEYYEKMGFAKDEDFVDLSLRREPKIDTERLLEKKPVAVFTPQIFFYDCDINNHINNIVYLDWLLRTVPVSYMKTHKPSMIDIMWIHEVHMDDTVNVSMYEIEKDYFGFIVNRPSDNCNVCTAEIRFYGEEA